MSQLSQALTARIQGVNSLEDLAHALEQTLLEIAEHEATALAPLAGAPDDLVGPERGAVQKAYQSYRDLVAEAQEKIRDTRALQTVAESLDQLQGELGLALTKLQEIAWSARGPSSHPGANQLLALLEGLAEGQALEERFEQVLELELERVQHQAPLLERLPDFARLPQQEAIERYCDWISAALEPETDDREWDDLIEELEEWASEFSRFDVDFLVRRYSGTPTAIPSVNLALNCVMLDLEELIPEEMVDYAIDAAQQSLREGQAEFFQGASLDDVERDRHEELIEELCADLDELPEVEDAAELRTVGGVVIGRAAELVALHGRAEGVQAGSRMDFRAGA